MPAEAKRRGVAALTNARGDRVDLPHRILARPRPRIEIAANDDRDVVSVVRASQPCERGRLRRAAGPIVQVDADGAQTPGRIALARRDRRDHRDAPLAEPRKLDACHVGQWQRGQNGAPAILAGVATVAHRWHVRQPHVLLLRNRHDVAEGRPSGMNRPGRPDVGWDLNRNRFSAPEGFLHEKNQRRCDAAAIGRPPAHIGHQTWDVASAFVNIPGNDDKAVSGDVGDRTGSRGSADDRGADRFAPGRQAQTLVGRVGTEPINGNRCTARRVARGGCQLLKRHGTMGRNTRGRDERGGAAAHRRAIRCHSRIVGRVHRPAPTSGLLNRLEIEMTKVSSRRAGRRRRDR